jgi:hypothetical protein
VLGLLVMGAAVRADTMALFITSQFQAIVGVSVAALFLMRRQINPLAAQGGEGWLPEAEVGSRMAENGDQKTEVGGRGSEIGGRRSETRGRRAEVGFRWSEGGGSGADARAFGTLDAAQHAEEDGEAA